MPLLCLYADVVGILGGVVVAIGMLDLSFVGCLGQPREAVAAKNRMLDTLRREIGEEIAVAWRAKRP